ncbi:MAG TPA: hypothetical protein VGL81_23450 [Polyangiaceae bacterium]|jgi:hypothetical protein
MRVATTIPKEAIMSVLPEHLPSLRALSAGDDRILADELRILAARQQLAIVRTISDEMEWCLAHRVATNGLREQLVEELARLGCRSVEAAAVLATPDPVYEQSGVHELMGS